ncbi:uncharacterized protein CDV56_101827 [Aspergillus thermomutatus]|uniref:Amidohydrolase-related domain-containing protein n=1 Tax=Aspergillus thermomutatus TaxID=41047 RepID=A0A397G2M7_ASPTH|nr:uncharacterized protein CDV56_101827 [Aspergillus thermomutatus]RHZ44134.1 hypothetical protein CDV56_101827 [Aspergillus thermomutatus]
MNRITTWSSHLEFDNDPIPEWWHTTLDSLAKIQPFGNGRVYLGLAFDMFSLPRHTVVGLWEKCRRLGLNLITTHYVAGAMTNSVKLLFEYGLLKKDVLFSHATQISESDAKTLVEHGVFISTTPDTELQMGLGECVAFRKDIMCNASFGVDCHANNSSDILTQIRLGMQHARGIENVKALENGHNPAVQIKLEEAFNLGTIQGAKAIHMENQIGSIAEGKLADIVVFDARTPAMVCAAEQNPLAAILLHGSIRDIDMVIVDGMIRKQDKRLCSVSVLDGPNGKAVRSFDWDQVAEKLLESRRKINERSQSQNREAAIQSLHKFF